ncbi:hypothetical protein D9M70_514630 [compost metagenome]
MLPASFRQVSGYPPDALIQPLHDTGPTQGFQTAHMVFDLGLGIVSFRSLRPGQRQVMVGAIHAIYS